MKQQHQDSSNVTIHERDQIINKIKHQVPTSTSIGTWIFYVPTCNDILHHPISLKSLQVINNWEKLKSYFRNFDPAGCATIPANNMKVSTLCFYFILGKVQINICKVFRSNNFTSLFQNVLYILQFNLAEDEVQKLLLSFDLHGDGQ